MRPRYISRYPWFQFPYYRGHLMQSFDPVLGMKLIDDMIEMRILDALHESRDLVWPKHPPHQKPQKMW